MSSRTAFSKLVSVKEVCGIVGVGYFGVCLRR